MLVFIFIKKICFKLCPPQVRILVPSLPSTKSFMALRLVSPLNGNLFSLIIQVLCITSTNSVPFYSTVFGANIRVFLVQLQESPIHNCLDSPLVEPLLNHGWRAWESSSFYLVKSTNKYLTLNHWLWYHSFFSLISNVRLHYLIKYTTHT